MEVFRLTRRKYSKVLSGKGAAFQGARWNSKGVEMLYAASSRALAMAEVSVYFTLATLPQDYVMLTIQVPEDVSSEDLPLDSLSINWQRFPHPKTTKKLGDSFISDGKACVLRVPSAIVPGDYNYVMNPQHPDFNRIHIVASLPFPFNDRIIKE